MSLKYYISFQTEKTSLHVNGLSYCFVQLKGSHSKNKSHTRQKLYRFASSSLVGTEICIVKLLALKIGLFFGDIIIIM